MTLFERYGEDRGDALAEVGGQCNLESLGVAFECYLAVSEKADAADLLGTQIRSVGQCAYLDASVFGPSQSRGVDRVTLLHEAYVGRRVCGITLVEAMIVYRVGGIG